MIRESSGDGSGFRRFLDMLAGWAEYLERAEHGSMSTNEADMYRREGDEVRRFYVRFATMSGPYSELDRVAYVAVQKEVLDLIVLGVNNPSAPPSIKP